MSEAALAATRPILGVTSSVLGRAWQARLDEAGEQRAMALAQAHGLPDLLARVLASRAIGVESVAGYLAPKLRDLLCDPSTLVDMDKAVARLAQGVKLGEHVALFGDYDADGACSVALFASYLRDLGCEVSFHIPDRLTEGYGPNVEAVTALARKGATLLVTLDCGTMSHGPLAEAKRLGLDVIVIDHHLAPETLPPADALVNPNRQDDLSGLTMLCAAGVAFVVLVALNRELRRRNLFSAERPEPDLFAALDLVALATIADVMPLTGLNRALVRQGLAVMKARSRLGLRALADAARLDGEPAPYHLGFLLGPRINAGGRIGDASLGARLLMSRDETEAANMAATLDRLNAERRVIEEQALEAAQAQAQAALSQGDAPVILAHAPDWHPGVVGLVAARLKERHRRPAFAFSVAPDGTMTGSGRSIEGADLGRAVAAAVEAGLALKGGGHAMAAGATLRTGGAGAFLEFVSQRLRSAVEAGRARSALMVDALATAAGASPELVATLERAGPFGAGSPEPVVVLGGHILADAAVVGTGHVRARLRSPDGASLSAIAFRAAEEPLGKALLAARGGRLHIAGTLSVDRWGGSERAQMRIVDAAEA
ncbi:MAG: single-stranded-DNA-specific exonuclease RecJ [Hyphomicrobiales bacterium]|nr:single-stranded-DNA-specific exonuclease RecJ [Hyphomicrobiales bacterium]